MLTTILLILAAVALVVLMGCVVSYFVYDGCDLFSYLFIFEPCMRALGTLLMAVLAALFNRDS